MMELNLPWGPVGDGLFDSDAPAEETVFTVSTIAMEGFDVQFKVGPTNRTGIDSGRVRCRVECLTCGKLIHEATTGASLLVKSHLRGEHGWQGIRLGKTKVDDV